MKIYYRQRFALWAGSVAYPGDARRASSGGDNVHLIEVLDLEYDLAADRALWAGSGDERGVVGTQGSGDRLELGR